MIISKSHNLTFIAHSDSNDDHDYLPCLFFDNTQMKFAPDCEERYDCEERRVHLKPDSMNTYLCHFPAQHVLGTVKAECLPTVESISDGFRDITQTAEVRTSGRHLVMASKPRRRLGEDPDQDEDDWSVPILVEIEGTGTEHAYELQQAVLVDDEGLYYTVYD